MSEVFSRQQQEQREHTLSPKGLRKCHLRHIPKIVQTTELRVVAMTDFTNLVFAFTTESLKDATIFYFTCQGTMKNASS
jgi:hypothetical protein